MRVQPYGYDLDPETRKRVVNEVEAEVAVRVFSLYAEGVHMQLDSQYFERGRGQDENRQGVESGCAPSDVV